MTGVLNSKICLMISELRVQTSPTGPNFRLRYDFLGDVIPTLLDLRGTGTAASAAASGLVVHGSWAPTLGLSSSAGKVRKVQLTVARASV